VRNSPEWDRGNDRDRPSHRPTTGEPSWATRFRTRSFSPERLSFCEPLGLAVCKCRLATFRDSLRRSPCLLRCGRGIRTHTAARLRRARKPARREWRPEGATGPAGRTDGSPAGRWPSISRTCAKVTRESVCNSGRAVNGGDSVCR
jgi:hypothetical protein